MTVESTRTDQPVVRWKITVPQHIAAAVEAKLFDHARGKPAYGARAKLISELLEKWLVEGDQVE